ncbi:tripartite tricarboxylate transporter TctB family protein [Sutcliffiella horikoshii]|uniref:tripartite tricarboxylate transporter TctB family protein n=1 Tax=Sutcliffiella horikoshii TaxID=79883 RepID=UPI001CBCAF9C|nr:tripartite tricarboxylate transporter TctB family protein [Sutcliffiella horikoshii]UAL48021.1 tripartite tricarboxylate transporter TctB family protein [Sutcliffiella horikoshii]
MTNVKKDYLFYSIVILFALSFMMMTPQIKITNASFIIGPRSWPYILLTLMISLALFGILKNYILSKKMKMIEPGELVEEHEPEKTVFKLSIPMISLIMLIIYVLLLNVIGFVISTPLFLYGISLLLGQKKQLYSVIFGFVTTVVFVGLFSVLLSIPLPRGIGVFRQLSLLFY